MSLRLKLIITYIVMLLMSVSIIFFAGMGLVSVAIRYSVTSMIGNQTLEEAFHRVIDIAVDLRYTEKNNPKILSQDNFATNIAKQVAAFDGFIVVKNDKQYKVYGAKNFDNKLFSQVEGSAWGIHKSEQGIDRDIDSFSWNGEEYNVIEYEFEENPNSLKYFFIIKNKNAENAERRYNLALIIGLLALTVIIIGPLLWIITKDIVIPLKKLDNAAKDISAGNLNFQLQSKSKNEIGSVIRSYEKMRFELKKSLDNQIEMDENRKQLLSNIAHDLKTPITSIKGYVQGIRDGVANDQEKLSKYLDVIFTKSEDMNAMIDDLFLFSKLDLGKESFNMDQVDIVDFYNNCLQELQMDLKPKGVELKAECIADQGLKVFMDSQKIKRVILNIVSNSIKFMEKENKVLEMLFSVQNQLLTVKIKDNGIGIGQKDLVKIFDRFYRTDPSRNRDTGGSGLGLAIAKQIIEQHKGTIEAKSKKGEWTEISFTFPVNR